jgi:hypothetical protein
LAGSLNADGQGYLWVNQGLLERCLNDAHVPLSKLLELGGRLSHVTVSVHYTPVFVFILYLARSLELRHSWNYGLT